MSHAHPTDTARFRWELPTGDSLAESFEYALADSLERALVDLDGESMPLDREAVNAAIGERYEVLRLLGEGGMGAVWLVDDKERNLQCALKTLGRRRDARGLLRLKSEFRAACELRHPNLLRLHELGEREGLWYFTMEHVEGAHVDRALASEAPPRDLRASFSQLLDGLSFLHARGLVHRDLKPSNLLLRPDGQLVLLDYGIACGGSALRVDRRGEVVGTLAYLAPEQILGGDVGPAADLYALGCLLFELVAGHPPFAGSACELLGAHAHREAPRLSELTSDAPPWVVTACDGLLAKAPEERPSISELREIAGLPRTPAPNALPFVGRGRELEKLDVSLGEALAGRGGALVVEGESGAGKSTLLERALASSAATPFVVLWGRCFHREGIPHRALDAVVDKLALLLRDSGLTKHDAIAATAAADASHLFSGLALLGHRSEPASTGSVRREKALRGLVHLLEAAQRLHPLVVVLDDLHWADPDSLSLLEDLVAHLSGTRILFVALSRPEAPSTNSSLARLLKSSDTRRMSLQPLDASALSTLWSCATGARASENAKLFERYVELSEGNAFVAVELAKEMSTTPSGERGVDEILGRRVREPSLEARKLLKLVSISPSPVGLRQLRNASGYGGATTWSALDELLDRSLVRANSGLESDAYSPYHDRFRTLTCDLLERGEATRLHLALAAAYEEESEPSHFAEALLAHYTAADDHEGRLRALPMAAEKAAARQAFARAAELLESWLEEAPAAEVEEPASTWARVGRLHQDAGQLVASIAAQRHALECRGLAEAARRDVEVRLAGALLFTHQVDEALNVYRGVTAPLGARIDRGLVESLLVLGWLRAQTWLGGRLPALRKRDLETLRMEVETWSHLSQTTASFLYLSAGEFALRARLAAHRMNNPRAALNAEVVSIYADTAVSPGERSLARAQRKLDELTRSVEDPSAYERAVLTVGRAFLMLQQDAHRACDLFENAVELLGEAGLGRNVVTCQVLHYVGNAAMDSGRFDDVISACNRIDEHHRKDGSGLPFLAAETGEMRARLAVRRGEAARTRELIRGMLGRIPDEPMSLQRQILLIKEAELLIYDGRPREALRQIAQHGPALRRTGLQFTDISASILTLVQLEANLELLRTGEKPVWSRWRMGRTARSIDRRSWLTRRCMGTRALAELAALAGNVDEARALIRRALSMNERYAEPYHRWLCLGTAVELGMEGSMEERDALAARFGFRPWAPSRRASGSGLTARAT